MSQRWWHLRPLRSYRQCTPSEVPPEIMDRTLELDTKQFKDVSLKSMVKRYGLCCGERLEEWVDEQLSSALFSERMRIPLEIVATDMLHYRPVTFSAERFPELRVSVAAAASSLVPGVFGYKSLSYSGKKYALVDGSLMS